MNQCATTTVSEWPSGAVCDPVRPEGTKQTIFVTASLPMMVRNLVRTSLLDMIAERYRVVLLCPFANAPGFREEMREFQIATERLPVDSRFLGRAGYLLYFIASTRRLARVVTTGSYFCSEQVLRKQRPIHGLLHSLIGGLNYRGVMERIGRRIWTRAWAKDAECSELFQRYQPIAFISTHPYLDTEWPMLWHARKRSLPLIASIHSWDNPSLRGELPVDFDRVLVWSELMKKDLRACNPGLRAERIVAVGAPAHDLFLDPGLIHPREKFVAELGLDPNRPLITYAAFGKSFRYEGDAIRRVVKAIEDKSFVKSPQLWVRFYGDDKYKAVLPFVENRRDVAWEQASSEFWGAMRVETDWRKGGENQHYLNLLAHSDVVVCGPSTVSVDAAMLDRPIVNACYDGARTLPYWESVRRLYFSRNHYQRIVCSGGVRLAFDDEELLAQINDYLTDPSQDRAARKRMVTEICGPLDGQNRARFAHAIVRVLRELAPEKS